MCEWSERHLRDRLLRAGARVRRWPGNATNWDVLDKAALAALVGLGRSSAQIADRTGYTTG